MCLPEFVILTSMNKEENLIWIDCEFTGLDYQNHTIIEIAVIITNKQLEHVTEPLEIVIHQSDTVLEHATDWVKEHIPEVLEASRNSKVSITEAQDRVLEYLQAFTEEQTSPLCGNSIGSDRHMLYYKMPQVEAWCDYRNIDVSTLKELSKRWKPEVEESIIKKQTHRALDDILESIEELKIYRRDFLR